MAFVAGYSQALKTGLAVDAISNREASSAKASSSLAPVNAVHLTEGLLGRASFITSTGSRLSRSPFVESSLTGTSVCFSKPARHSLKSSCAIAKASAVGEDPDWNDDDYIVLGLAHCFQKDDDGKLKDALIVEPVTAGTLECMENGGVTCYKHAIASTLGVALQQDISLLPEEYSMGTFCVEFDFRAKCASRTWKRDHPREHLMNLVPKSRVRSDFNFSLEDKRVLNVEVVVNDSDNIKQDMSIDVYGRQKEDELQKEISTLYGSV